MTQDDGTSHASIAQAFASNVTAGNCIVVGIGYGNNTTGLTDGATVTDSLSNTYTRVSDIAWDNSNSQATEVYVAYNITGGANTVTLTFVTARPYNRFIIAEYSGIQTTASPVDQHNNGFVLSGSTATDGISTGSVTTTSASETLLSIYQDTSEAPGTGTLSAGTNFALDVQDGTAGTIAIESRTLSTTGTYGATWTRSVSTAYAGITVSLVNSTGATNGFLNRNYFWDNY